MHKHEMHQWKFSLSVRLHSTRDNGWLALTLTDCKYGASPYFIAVSSTRGSTGIHSAMDDEAFDICENIWNHEWAMQRLLSILRHRQSYCTDIECFNLSQLPGPGPAVTSSSDFLMTCLMIAFAVLMYVLRPNTLRQLRNDTGKDRDNEHDSNNEPPAPSAAQ